jgi:hypothetical protein
MPSAADANRHYSRCAGLSKRREYSSIELLVEGDAVEARRVRAYFRDSLRQCRRTDHEGEVPGVRHQMILVLCRQILFTAATLSCVIPSPP